MTENSSNNRQSSSAKNSSSDESHATLGKYLKQARLNQNKSVEEVAEATRIHASTIKALEEDDRSKLPAEVFTRGFIKIYASHLGLSPHDALQRYDQKGEVQWTATDEKINAQEVLSTETLAESPSIITGTKIFMIIAAVVVFFFGYYLYKTYQSLPKPLEETSTQLTEPSPSSALSPPTAAPAETEEASVPHDEDTTAHQDIDSADTEPAMAQQPAATPVKEDEAASRIEKPAKKVNEQAPPIVEETKPTPVEETKPAPAEKNLESTPSPDQQTQQEDKEADTNVIAAGPAEAAVSNESAEPTPKTDAQEGPYNYILNAQFSEITWMRVQIDDQRPREYTYQPGTEHTWKARDKMEIFIGNAGGVALTLNDEPLAALGKSGQIYKLSIPTTPNP